MGHYDTSGQYILDPGEAEALRAYAQAHANDTPNVPQADLAQMVNPSTITKDAQGHSVGYTYTGQRRYINDGSWGPMPTNSYMHSYGFDPIHGGYKASLNSGGVLGTIEGAAALAGPAAIGPALAGGGAAAAPAGITVSTSPYAAPEFTTIPGIVSSAAAETTGAAAGGAAGGALGASMGGDALPSSNLPTSSLMTGPAGISSQGVSETGLGAFPGLGSTDPGVVPGGAVPPVAAGALDALKNPRNIASLAAMLPFMKNTLGGGSNPFTSGPIADQINHMLQLQSQRMQAAQPAYDALVRAAYGMAPTAYRGAPPPGYVEPDTSNTIYRYQAPTFGGSK